jgi:hypothetical protein
MVPSASDDLEFEVPATFPDWDIAPGTAEALGAQQGEAILGYMDKRTAILPADSI